MATVNHFTHNHLLTKYVGGEVCVCGLCKVKISSARYGCNRCNFYLHKFCATSPLRLFASTHTHHELTLTHRDNHTCDLCDTRVEGMFYRCEGCDFDLHPICSQLTHSIQHVLHPDHPLTLHKFTTTPTSPPPCLLCNDKCTHLFYKCQTCTSDVCIHFGCIRRNARTVLAQTTAVPAQATVLAQVPAQPYIRRRYKVLGVAVIIALNLMMGVDLTGLIGYFI